MSRLRTSRGRFCYRPRLPLGSGGCVAKGGAVGLIDLLIVAVGLSMDAFAASICKGFQLQRVRLSQALAVAGAFGGFQALMPLVGWLLGVSFAGFIEPVDHWIAFVLLVILGGKMIWDSLHEDDGEAEADRCEVRLRPGEILLLAVATSIDALAVGVSLAFLGVGIIESSLIIGAVTFAICFAGIYVGSRFGARFGSKATIFGGLVLIAIGCKILVEHLGIL